MNCRKIANFTPDERVNYLENQKMRFDYENVPVDFICRVTGLSQEEIQGL